MIVQNDKDCVDERFTTSCKKYFMVWEDKEQVLVLKFSSPQITHGQHRLSSGRHLMA